MNDETDMFDGKPVSRPAAENVDSMVRAMSNRQVVVCPQEEVVGRRFHGGRRYKATSLACGRCGAKVVVPLDVWRVWRFHRDAFAFVCEQCDVLETFTDSAK